MSRFTHLDPGLKAQQAHFESLLDRLRSAQVAEDLIEELAECVYGWITSTGRLSEQVGGGVGEADEDDELGP
jgi:hypothetical protein